ncbi:MAG TPA: coenzyme F420-0:L-glutamate ligase [Vicinamibacteria bacterium]|jgi:coenzyme F420-0:L-glutamate ligase/coenzyme F420-1:gamma-L-glutamate ligase|nr:coenzyme F420-0:L-glutamate ligase [Vicinamibacteria bacterium]
MTAELRIVGVPGVPEVVPGDDLAALLVYAIRRADIPVEAGDVVVVTQKVVSKAEGRLVRLADIEPSASTVRWAEEADRDARLVELALREAVRVVRMEAGVLVTETAHGLICANSGVDASNVAAGFATLLPVDPDASARRIGAALAAAFGRPVAVVVSDTFGRPWREGQTNVAVGVAGLRPLVDHRGTVDPFGHRLQSTVIALADELAAAAELVMGKTAGIPAAIIKGAPYEAGDGSARELQRPREHDLFR